MTDTSFRHKLVAQFHRPHGWMGRLAGAIMARRPSNRDRNLWTVDLLDIQPADRILELGFGPGLSIQAASARAPRGRVVGFDHSQTMLAMARRRNTAAIRDGRVELRLGSFSELPSFAEPFDKILAVNSLQFSDNPEKLLRSLVECLRPGGTLAITFQSRKPGATDEDSRLGGEQRAKLLQAAGLTDVRVELLPLEPVCAVCVLGRRAV